MINHGEDKNYCKPFREFKGKKGNFYLVRLGPKIYAIASEHPINKTFFNWRSVQVQIYDSESFRPIKDDELEKPWVKSCLQAEVNYQKKIEASNHIKIMEQETRLRHKRKHGKSWWGR